MRYVLAILIGMVSFTLAACNEQSTIPIQGTNCGTLPITQNVATLSLNDIDCLLNAYHNCTAATLLYRHYDADQLYQWGLTVQPGDGSCRVLYTRLYHGNGGSWRKTQHTCGNLAKESRGLVAYCGEQVEIFPLPPDWTYVTDGNGIWDRP